MEGSISRLGHVTACTHTFVPKQFFNHAPAAVLGTKQTCLPLPLLRPPPSAPLPPALPPLPPPLLRARPPTGVWVGAREVVGAETGRDLHSWPCPSPVAGMGEEGRRQAMRQCEAARGFLAVLSPT